MTAEHEDLQHPASSALVTRLLNQASAGNGQASAELLPDSPDDLLALDEALVALAEVHPEKAKLVKLRYFAGLSTEQAAEALRVSVRTGGRDWAYVALRADHPLQ